MKTLKNWTLHKQSAHHVELLVDGQHILCLYVLEENLFRVLLKRKGELLRRRMCHGKGAAAKISAALACPRGH